MNEKDPGDVIINYIRLAVIGIVLIVLAWRSNWFDSINARALVVLIPLILTLIAKLISRCKGDEGKCPGHIKRNSLATEVFTGFSAV